MKVVYVSGPIRAKTAWERELNIRYAEAVAYELWAAGFAVICPHANTRFFGDEGDGIDWIAGDIEIVKRCDGVYMLYGWENSAGAKAELKAAVDNNIPIFLSVQDMVKRLK